ncbi:MAG: methyltransferase domain-containing protein [Rhodospirillales bacterium]|nr:methyltransferase domain-containing protein [Rhodospirillales bacterium]
MRAQASRDAAHFERLYASDPDPWCFLSSPYEQRKYDLTLATLGERQFANAFEAGCSIGVLTARLAPRCNALLAADMVETALESARQRCAAMHQVRLAKLRLPAQWPPGRFDLILLSEILYFLSPAEVTETAKHCRASLAPGGSVLLVNYTGPTDDPCSGDEAANIFSGAAAPFLTQTLHERHDRFRIDCFA